MKRLTMTPIVAALLSCLSACNTAPPYQPPSVDVPQSWSGDLHWQPAGDSAPQLRASWWEAFGDPQLNDCEQLVSRRNQTLKLAYATLLQARADSSLARSALYPHVEGGVGAARERISKDRPQINYAVPTTSTTQNDVNLRFTATYEIDLFGRIRNAAEQASANEAQSADDLAAVSLLLHSELAVDYFLMHELDAELDVVQQSIDAQREALRFVSHREVNGAASSLDVAQQQAQLDSTGVQVGLLRRRRAQLEHAIATLTGQPAPSFSIEADSSLPDAPRIPVSIPSTLLERRPDVAAHERAVAAANAAIGIARSAYFPDLSLGVTGGWETTALTTLVSAPTALWAVGMSAAQTIFDAGATSAKVRHARAAYDGAIAQYRQTALNAMQEVEDGISNLNELDDSMTSASAAVASSSTSLRLATVRYQDGVATYLDVITAQQTLLSARRQLAQIQGARLVDTVNLIRSLGGGWTNT